LAGGNAPRFLIVFAEGAHLLARQQQSLHLFQTVNLENLATLHAAGLARTRLAEQRVLQALIAYQN